MEGRKSGENSLTIIWISLNNQLHIICDNTDILSSNIYPALTILPCLKETIKNQNYLLPVLYKVNSRANARARFQTNLLAFTQFVTRNTVK